MNTVPRFLRRAPSPGDTGDRQSIINAATLARPFSQRRATGSLTAPWAARMPRQPPAIVLWPRCCTSPAARKIADAPGRWSRGGQLAARARFGGRQGLPAFRQQADDHGLKLVVVLAKDVWRGVRARSAPRAQPWFGLRRPRKQAHSTAPLARSNHLQPAAVIGWSGPAMLSSTMTRRGRCFKRAASDAVGGAASDEAGE